MLVVVAADGQAGARQQPMGGESPYESALVSGLDADAPGLSVSILRVAQNILFVTFFCRACKSSSRGCSRAC